MAQTPEARVKAIIKKILKSHGIYYSMPIGNGFGNSGVPDFLCSVPPHGKFLAIEAKAGGGKTTALQDKNLKEIELTGGYPLVVNEYRFEMLEEVIESLKR